MCLKGALEIVRITATARYALFFLGYTHDTHFRGPGYTCDT